MIWVVMAPMGDGYCRMAKAASDLHFKLEDDGLKEIGSGNWYDMLELMRNYEDAIRPDSEYYIELYCQATFSIIHTNDECLQQMLDIEPNYLDKKLFL